MGLDASVVAITSEHNRQNRSVTPQPMWAAREHTDSNNRAVTVNAFVLLLLLIVTGRLSLRLEK